MTEYEESMVSTEIDIVEVARQETLSRRSCFDFASRRTETNRTPGGWHISFPQADPEMLGGEPHVYLDEWGTLLTSFRLSRSNGDAS